MNIRTGALAATVAAWATLAAPPAGAMQMDLTPAELCGLSTAVVYGTVTDVDTMWAPGPEGKIERRAFVSVERVLTGAPMQGAEIVLPGGTIGKQWTWVEDVPELKADATYVLFLHALDDGAFEVIGGDGGALRVAVGGIGEGQPLSAIARTLEGCRAK